MDLWVERRVPTKGIILVSHNIEEAVEIADRIIVFGSDPGRIRAEIPVPLARPRDIASPRFRQIVDEVYASSPPCPGAKADGAARRRRAGGHRLSPARRLDPAAGRSARRHLRAALFRPRRPAASGRERAHRGRGAVRADRGAAAPGLRPGRAAATSRRRPPAAPSPRPICSSRKQIFADQLRRSIPLAAHIRKVLDERPGQARPRRASSPSSRIISPRRRRSGAGDGDQLGPLCRALRL